MSSIFTGKSGLRLVFKQLTFAQLTPAISQATSILLDQLSSGARIAYFDNDTNARVSILFCHPDADSTVATNRLKAFEIGAGRVVNFGEFTLPNIEFDPGTTVWVYANSVPTSGNLSIVYWG